jgi:kynureninase
MPKNVSSDLMKELDKWKLYGVEGHFAQEKPWYSYHEPLLAPMAAIVGARAEEIVLMNSLTTNLHLMMVSFYRPTKKRFKILMEKGAFPSDIYAIKSQIRFHGYNVEESLLEIGPRDSEDLIREEDILDLIEKEGEHIALVCLSGVQYRTGQVFPLEKITDLAHAKGAMVGFDLAHAAGNIELHLHQWNVDFAVWCNYKYLNAGPGAISGAFIHKNHHSNKNIPRFEGWWGTNQDTRFQMGPQFDPIPSALAWQLSNPPIFQLCALGSSLTVFSQTKMSTLIGKGRLLTGLLHHLIESVLPSDVDVITSRNVLERGQQLSLRLKNKAKADFPSQMHHYGVICDFRHPDIVRVAPCPLYNTFEDVWNFVTQLSHYLENQRS